MGTPSFLEFMPDLDLASSQTGSPDVPVSSPAPGTVAPPSPDPGVGASGPAAVAADASVSGGVAPAQPQFVSVRDHLRELGYGQLADGYENDQTLVADLVRSQESARQALALAQYGQRYLQHAGEFERYLSERQAPQQPRKDSKWWNPPEFNPSWRGLVSRDESGNLVTTPGAPPDVLPKYLAYEQYRRDFADRFLSNPEEALSPLIQEKASSIAQEIVNSHLSQMREEHQAGTFLRENASWLHQRDQNGGLVRDYSGRPVLSPAGRQFRSYVEEAEQIGIQGVAAQERYATRLLRADLVAAGIQPQNSQPSNAQLKQQFLQNGSRQPNHGGSVSTTPDLTGRVPEQNQGLSLAERLRRDLAANGINDAAFFAPTGA